MPEVGAQDFGSSLTCKAPGCTEDAKWKGGPLKGLCERHAAPIRQRMSQSQTLRAASERDGFEAKVKHLARVGKDVDRLRADAKALTEKALAASARAKEAEREFRALAAELMGASGIGVEVER